MFRGQNHLSAVPSTVLARLRQPAYTGENRCVPCTTVNLLIAIAVSALLAVFFPPIGGLSLVLSIGTIYLRGYLVPGTPRLTKRYFPDWLLQRFDKGDIGDGNPIEEGIENPESVLVRASALTECTNHDDLCLSEPFRAALDERITVERNRAAVSPRSRVVNLLGIDDDRLSFEDCDGAFIARANGRPIGQWPSHVALLADSATATLLACRDSEWESRSPAERSQLLAGLRLFLDTCPACEGPLAFGEETVESCCRSVDVIAVDCEECDAQLFEIEHTEEMV